VGEADIDGTVAVGGNSGSGEDNGFDCEVNDRVDQAETALLTPS